MNDTKNVAGLRVQETAPQIMEPLRPVVLKTYKCPKCAFHSPIEAAVRQHITRQHVRAEAKS